MWYPRVSFVLQNKKIYAGSSEKCPWQYDRINVYKYVLFKMPWRPGIEVIKCEPETGCFQAYHVIC